MNLVRTSILNAFAVAVRALASLALNKVLALSIGPSGYAMMGQFQNAISVIMTGASGAINTGVTKYTAEYGNDTSRQETLWKTAGSMATMATIAASVVIALMRRQLASWFLHDESYRDVFLWFSLTLWLFVLNALLLAILNGKKEINRYISINIANSLVSLAVTGWLAWRWGVRGALIAMALNQSIVVAVTLALCQRTTWFRWSNLVGNIDGAMARRLLKFAAMALTTAVAVPMSQLLIRNHLGAMFGWDSAGYWQALIRVSDLYLLVITGSISLYYLPRISEITVSGELRHEIAKAYRFLLPLTIASSAAIFATRDWIIQTLFARSFGPMRVLVGWQLVGDILKIGGWLLGYVTVAQSMTLVFIATEISLSALSVMFAYLLTARYGLVGVSLSYCATYVAYWLVMAFVVRGKLRQMPVR